MTTKQRLHELVDNLPDDMLRAVERVLTHPEWRMFLCTPDDEPPLSLEEITGIYEGLREAKEGQTYRFKNVEDAIAWLHNGPEPRD